MDPLSRALAQMRTEGRIWGFLSLNGPYGIGFPPEYGVFLSVVEGETWLGLDDEPPRRLMQNDLVFLPRPSRFSLHSTPLGSAVTMLDAGGAARWAAEKRIVVDGGTGPAARIVTGCFSVTSPEAALLVRELPRLLHMGADENREITAALAMLRHEIGASPLYRSRDYSRSAGGNDLPEQTARPGASAMIDRLCEILLLLTIRHMIGSPGQIDIGTMHDRLESGWLRGLGDPKIGSALQHMHAKLAAPWTVEEIARQCGMSRSAFATRFKSVVGITPMDHLTEWRMARAAALLQGESALKIDSLAHAVGYSSERAFRKNFLRCHGLTPQEYRRQQRG